MKLLLTTAILAISTTSAFADEKVVWGGGNPDQSTYSGKYVPAVIDGLASNRLSGYEWGGVSQGTMQNVENVRNNPTHLAVGQFDLIEGLPGITILHKDIGPECLYMVTKEEGYSNLGHVIGNSWDLSVVTGGELSGSFGTWNNLTTIYTDFADMPVNHAGGAGDIIDAVQASADPAIGFFVMRPDPNSSVFQKISEAGLTFIPVIDIELEDNYDFFNLKVAKSGLFGLGSGDFVETACTSVALFTGVADNLDGRDLRRLEATIERVQATPAEAFTPSTSDFSDMFSSMTAVAADRAAELSAAAKEAISEAADNIRN